MSTTAQMSSTGERINKLGSSGQWKEWRTSTHSHMEEPRRTQSERGQMGKVSYQTVPFTESSRTGKMNPQWPKVDQRSLPGGGTKELSGEMEMFCMVIGVWVTRVGPSARLRQARVGLLGPCPHAAHLAQLGSGEGSMPAALSLTPFTQRRKWRNPRTFCHGETTWAAVHGLDKRAFNTCSKAAVLVWENDRCAFLYSSCWV